MTVATALAVSWKPLTNSKPRAISNARESKRYGQMLVTVTDFMSLTTCSAMKHKPPARAARNNAILLAPGRLVMWLSSRDPFFGSASTVAVNSAIRVHQCGRRDSGHAWASEVERFQ